MARQVKRELTFPRAALQPNRFAALKVSGSRLIALGQLKKPRVEIRREKGSAFALPVAVVGTGAGSPWLPMAWDWTEVHGLNAISRGGYQASRIFEVWRTLDAATH